MKLAIKTRVPNRNITEIIQCIQKNTEADSFAYILAQTVRTYLSYHIYLALKYPHKASELMLHGGKVKYLYLRATLSGSLNM